MELKYLANFGLDKERAWSGTVFSLFTALSKHFEVNEVNAALSIFTRVLLKILKIHWFNSSFFENWLNSKKFKKLNGNIFQFSEIKFDDEKTKTRTFIYQDLSVSYIKYMKENLPEVFEKSGYTDISSKILEKRVIYQNKYYSTCSKVFVMGHWLKKFLVEQGLLSDKVAAVGGGTNVNVNLINPLEKQNNKILFVGRDFERKGGFLTYEAFCMLKKNA